MQFLQHGMLHIFALISLVCKCLVVSSSASAGPLQLEPSAPYPHLYRMYEIWYHSPVNVLSFVQYLCFVQSLFPWFSLPSLCAVISPRVSFLAWCSSFPMELLCLQPWFYGFLLFYIPFNDWCPFPCNQWSIAFSFYSRMPIWLANVCLWSMSCLLPSHCNPCWKMLVSAEHLCARVEDSVRSLSSCSLELRQQLELELVRTLSWKVLLFQWQWSMDIQKLLLLALLGGTWLKPLLKFMLISRFRSQVPRLLTLTSAWKYFLYSCVSLLKRFCVLTCNFRPLLCLRWICAWVHQICRICNVAQWSEWCKVLLQC